MRKPKPAPPDYVAHASIVLDKVVPEVSRVVALPLSIRLDDLHVIIQSAMGWTGSHLWMFRARGMCWGVADPEFGDDMLPASRTLLLDMVADIGTYRFKYVYDFGDHWSHTIKVTKPMPAAPGVAYPLLLHAIGRCPPEDCGGAEGYVELLQALRDRSNLRHGDAIDQLGGDFDPAAVDLATLETNVAALADHFTPRRRAALKSKASPRSRKSKGDEFF